MHVTFNLDHLFILSLYGLSETNMREDHEDFTELDDYEEIKEFLDQDLEDFVPPEDQEFIPGMCVFLTRKESDYCPN